MKQSKTTGEAIYKELDKEYKILKELIEAMNSVSNDMGEGNMAFHFLKEKHLEKLKEIGRLERQDYTHSEKEVF